MMTTTGIRISLIASAMALLLAMSTSISGQSPASATAAASEPAAMSDTYRDVYQGW